MAAQRLLLGALGAAYGCSEAPYGCPWGPYGCSEAAFGDPWGCIWLLRGSIWVPMGLYMAAHGAPYGCSEVAFGCRGVAFCCAGAVYGSHAADMQYMLHLAGLGWRPGSREDAKLRGVGRFGAPNPTSRMRDQASRMNNQGSRLKDAHEL